MDFSDILQQWEKSQGSAFENENRKTIHKTLDKYLDQEPILDKDAMVRKSTKRINPRDLRIEDTIDLHGYRGAEAVSALNAFFSHCKSKGFRKVLIIHGKGNHSGGEGVIKRIVQDYLENSEWTGAFGHPPQTQGGKGATWVVIRYRSR